MILFEELDELIEDLFDHAWDFVANIFEHKKEVVEVVADSVENLRITDDQVLWKIVADITKTNPNVDEGTATIWARKIIEEASKYKINPFIIASQAKQESHWDPTAIGTSGDTGLLQIMGNTGKEIAKSLGYKNFNPRMLKDPMLNIEFSAYYLHDCYEKTAKYLGNDLANKDWLALASYNRGVIPAVKDYISGKLETCHYIGYVRRYFMESYNGVDIEF